MDVAKFRIFVASAIYDMSTVKIPEAEQNWYPPVAKRKRKKDGKTILAGMAPEDRENAEL